MSSLSTVDCDLVFEDPPPPAPLSLSARKSDNKSAPTEVRSTAALAISSKTDEASEERPVTPIVAMPVAKKRKGEEHKAEKKREKERKSSRTSDADVEDNEEEEEDDEETEEDTEEDEESEEEEEQDKETKRAREKAIATVKAELSEAWDEFVRQAKASVFEHLATEIFAPKKAKKGKGAKKAKATKAKTKTKRSSAKTKPRLPTYKRPWAAIAAVESSIQTTELLHLRKSRKHWVVEVNGEPRVRFYAKSMIGSILTCCLECRLIISVERLTGKVFAITPKGITMVPGESRQKWVALSGKNTCCNRTRGYGLGQFKEDKEKRITLTEMRFDVATGEWETVQTEPKKLAPEALKVRFATLYLRRSSESSLDGALYRFYPPQLPQMFVFGGAAGEELGSGFLRMTTAGKLVGCDRKEYDPLDDDLPELGDNGANCMPIFGEHNQDWMILKKPQTKKNSFHWGLAVLPRE